MHGGYRVFVWLLVWLIAFSVVLICIRLIPEIAPPWPGQDAATFLTAVAEILRAIQWPLVAVIVAIYFRKDVADLLTRIARWKGLGMELETREQLNDAVAATALWQAGGDIPSPIDQATSGAHEDRAPEQLPMEGIQPPAETSDSYWSR